MKRDHRARGLGIALQREHERVAVDDAGGRRKIGGDAAQLRLHRARLGAGQEPQISHAVRVRLRLDRLQLAELLLVGGHEQLSAPSVRNRALLAIRIQGQLAGDAEACLERTGRIVDPGVDHLAVARAGLGADALGRLEDDHLAAGEGEGARHRQADDTRADDDRVDAFHGAAGCRVGTCCLELYRGRCNLPPLQGRV